MNKPLFALGVSLLLLGIGMLYGVSAVAQPVQITRPNMILMRDGVQISTHRSEVEAMERASSEPGTYTLVRPDAKIIVAYPATEPEPDPDPVPEPDPIPDPIAYDGVCDSADDVASLPAGHWCRVPNSPLRAAEKKPSDYSDFDGTSSAQYDSYQRVMGVRGLTAAWNSGAFDTSRDCLMLFGGGGMSDYGGNEIYAFCLGDLSWQRLSDPTAFPNRTPAFQNDDGTPISRHTYNGLAYIEAHDRFFAFDGSPDGGDCGTVGTWTFNLQARYGSGQYDPSQWELRTTENEPRHYCDNAAAYDPVTGRVIFKSQDATHYYDFFQNAWVKLSSAGRLNTGVSLAVDPREGYLVEVGGGATALWDMDQSFVGGAVTTTGNKAIENAHNAGLVYDLVAQRIVGWSGGSSVYALNTVTKEWQEIPAADGNLVDPGHITASGGAFGRFNYSPKSNVYIYVDSVSSNVLLYRAVEGVAQPIPPRPVDEPSRFGDQVDWSEGQATRDFYNQAAGLEWRQRLGDWVDANGVLHGTAPYATTTIPDTDTNTRVRFNVTGLVNDWLSGEVNNQGFLLKGSGGSNIFRSREVTSSGVRPALIVSTPGGDVRIETWHDTHLNASTFQALGKQASMELSGQTSILLAFDLTPLDGVEILSATLELTSFLQYGALTVNVYAASTREISTDVVVQGLSAGFPNDEGIASHPDVIMFEGFEDAGWRNRWDNDDQYSQPVDPSVAGIPELSGRAFDATIPQGYNSGTNLYKYLTAETLYLRYYLYLDGSFALMDEGGKLPGIAGTYDNAGWGGRKPDGTNGWSARGYFGKAIPAGSALSGRVPFGTYLYHVDQPDYTGDPQVWNINQLGQLETGRWHCIEQQITMNDVGSSNGILRGWVDGKLAYENTGLRFRTVPEIRIDRVWMNVWHGGLSPAPVDMGVYLDNVVIAKSYIGPKNG